MYGTRQKKIGSGSFGNVYSTEHGYAMKISTSDECGICNNFMREAAILRYLNHPNIVKALKVSVSNDQPTLYMYKAEYSLKNFIDIGKINKDNTKQFIHQLLQAVTYCHKNNIIHRDIKPANIIVFPSGIQLIDFGTAFHTTNQSIEEPKIGSLWWRSPEMLLETTYGNPTDVWSIGVILYQMLYGYHPFPGDGKYNQLFKIFKRLGTPNEEEYPGVTSFSGYSRAQFNHQGIPFVKSDEVDSAAIDLLGKLLTWANKRISAEEALKHPYFTGLTITPTTRPYVPGIPNKSSINPKHRELVFSWLWEVMKDYTFEYDTLFLAYHIFDSYIGTPDLNLDKSTLQLYGITALHIAEKINEPHYVDISECVYMCDNKYTLKEILKAEEIIYSTLNLIIGSSLKTSMKSNNYIPCSLQKFNMLLAILYMNYTWATSWTSSQFLQVATDFMSGIDTLDILKHIEGDIEIKTEFRKL
jgi:serine/threonine protein kinase